MLKSLTLLAAFLLRINCQAQLLTLHFNRVNTAFSECTYLINCTEFGTLNIGSSAFLFDSVKVKNRKGTYSLPPKAEKGFYRLQNVPRERPPYSYLSKIRSVLYLYLDPAKHGALKLNFKCNDDFTPSGAEKLDPVNRELVEKQLFINRQRALLFLKLKSGQGYDAEKFVDDYLLLLCKAFEHAVGDITRVFLAQQIHEAKSIMPEERFRNLVKVDYTGHYSKDFMEGAYFRKFKSYVLEKFNVDVAGLAGTVLLDSSLHSKTLNISDQLTVIDCWASWCRPCRKENRSSLQKISAMALDGKFRLLSISFDTDPVRWKKALSEDNMKWEQYIDTTGVYGLLGKRSFSNVLGLPRLMVIRRSKVIAQNLLGEYLVDYIREQLEK